MHPDTTCTVGIGDRELHGFRQRILAIGWHIDCMDTACTV